MNRCTSPVAQHVAAFWRLPCMTQQQAPALRCAQGAAKSVGSLVSNHTSAARLYSLLTAALTGAGAAYLLAPQSSLAVRPLRPHSLLGGVNARGWPSMPGLQDWVPSRIHAEVLVALIQNGDHRVRNAAPLRYIAEGNCRVHA